MMFVTCVSYFAETLAVTFHVQFEFCYCSGFDGINGHIPRYGTTKRSPSAVGEFEPVTLSWKNLTVQAIAKKRNIFGSPSPKYHGKVILRKGKGASINEDLLTLIKQSILE